MPWDADIARSVRSAAGELPFRQAQALWLVDTCGCSYDDAAAEAGTTPGWIVRRVAGGRKELRRRVPAVSYIGLEYLRPLDDHGDPYEDR